MKAKSRLLVLIFSLIFILGLVYLETEALFPRDRRAIVSIEGTEGHERLIKEEQNGNYYISFIEHDTGEPSPIRLECTKEQYDFIKSGRKYHVLYKKNYFNRKSGKVLMLDDKPIYNGGHQIAKLELLQK